MHPDVIKKLKKEVPPDEIRELQRYVMERLDSSRRVMSKNYSRWDESNRIYRGEMFLDREDIEAKKFGEPVKFIVPLTFAQVQTFIAFLFLLYTQNQRYFLYRASGNEDESYKDSVERFVDRDLRSNKWSTLLVQLLLDIGRFGLGCLKLQWDEDRREVALPTPTQVDETGEIPTVQDGAGIQQLLMLSLIHI